MYQIKLGNYVLYDLRDDELILENPELNLEVNKVGSLSFSIYPNHPYFDRINKLSSVITILKDNNVIFKGRVISEEQGLYNSKKFECEGILSYLNDSIVRPYSFTGTPEEYFKNLLENHNNQVIGNLFDKNNFNELNANIKDGLINSAPAERTLYIKCEKNTTYTFSKLRGNIYPRFTIAETTDIPTIGSTYSNFYYSSNESDTYTTSSNAEYLVFWYYCNDSDLTKEEVLDSIKIVKGTINETKVIKVGEITVTDPNDYITRSSINYASTWDILNEDLINKLGGYLKVRYESDGTYIDYLSDFNDTSTQIIEFGENLIDVLVKNDAIDVYTAVIPLGAEIQNEDGTSEKLTIKSVNNGLDYIVNQEAYNLYGLIFAPVENTTWDDVTLPSNLLTKGTKYLNNQAVMLKSSLELSAIDLNIVDSGVENFFIYEYVRFISSVHNINERYLLTKITIPISSPENMKITLGKETSSLTGIEMGNKLNIDNIIQRVGRVESNYTIDNGKLNDIEKLLEFFSVDLSQYTITIPTDSNKKPLETKNIDVYFYGYYKGSQVTPSVSINGSTTGIATSIADTYVRFSVNSNTAIAEALSEYKLIFTYTIDNNSYSITKTINIALALAGEDGAPGEKGEPGIQGPAGANGSTYYFYVRYSANADGSSMTTSPQANTQYMGVASTTSSTAPTSYSAYTWTKIKGEQGSQGSPGQTGADGLSSYLHIKYSDDGINFTANSGETIGRYRGELVDNKLEDSTTFSDYKWYDMALIVDEELNEIREEIITNTTSIQQNQEEILMTALENYTSKTDFETFQSEVTSQFQQTSDTFEFNINNVVSQVNTVNGNVQQQFQELATYFRITGNGTELGKSDSDIILRQQNDRISFIQNNTEVAYISDSTLYITDAHFLVSIRIGNFAFKPRANGNLSLVKVN